MKFENILSEVNGFGKFQIRLVLIQMLSRITLPCHFVLNNFMAAVPSHHCNITPLDDQGLFWNLTQEQLLAVSLPTEPDGSPSSCQMFSKPQYQHLHGLNSSEDAVAVPCREGWVYDNSTFASTIATEVNLVVSSQWDLICSRKGMNKLTATIFFVGVMVGAPSFGFFSDRFGRRPLLLASYLATTLFAVLSAFSTSYIMFLIMRFFTGLSLAGVSIISIVLNVEWVSIERRTLCGIITSLDVAFGNWFLIAVAYCVNEWRMLILAVTSPLVLSVICWRWLPESARWLVANGKVDAAHRYLLQCAEMNNRTKSMETVTPNCLMESVQVKTKEKKYSFLDIFKTPNIRMLSICLGIVWFGAELTYYGISLNIAGFGLNLYLTQFVFASMEFLMKICSYFFLEKIGRRSSVMGALFLTGLCLLVNIFVPKDNWIVRTTVGSLGKGFSEVSCTVMYLYTTELYPTVLRQNGMGYSALVARLGVAISPLVMLLEDAWHKLPAVTYCAVALGTGLVPLLLRETLHTELPELIEDIEKPRKRENALKERSRKLTTAETPDA
ncbi:unnamed protein product [Tetraodon nigroviridis]|uniref:(spotted green pufferfish) hypothetical protein n=1 Tax=Tetraodon nigroviridis TaxID=99883 RepID=Q4S6J9_TETNG|nr:unnamed protein product [Tetraodon nigroviridis]